MILILLTVGKECSHDITRPVVVYFSSTHSNTTHAAGSYNVYIPYPVQLPNGCESDGGVNIVLPVDWILNHLSSDQIDLDVSCFDTLR